LNIVTMPFLTRNPAHYLPALRDDTTEPLHVGLYLGGGGENENVAGEDDDEPRLQDQEAAGESSWAELASSIRQTKRSIRCLWLRVGSGDGGGNDGWGDAATLSAMRALGRGLVGATSVESLVLEDRGVGPRQLECLHDFMAGNASMRGIKFLRTRLDAPSASMLGDFFEGDPTLRVLDLTSNPGVDDAVVESVLGAISRNGRCKLETLNLLERAEDEADAPGIGISESGVETIVSFVSRSECENAVSAC